MAYPFFHLVMREPLYLTCVLGALILCSCTRSIPDGHYHFEWGGSGNGFQAWNVKDGRMVINGPVLPPDSGFSSVIEIKGGDLIVDPWVDNTWHAKVQMEADGSMTVGGGSLQHRIVPHTNCISVAQYFKNRASEIMEDLQLASNYYSGRMEFPGDAPHELIVGKKGKDTAVMWDGVAFTTPTELPSPKSAMKDLWMHVDQRVSLQDVLPWITAAHARGYMLYFSTLESSENDEQVHLTKRDLVVSEQIGSTVVNDYCKDCELHSEEPVLVPAKLEFIGPDLLVFRGDTNDAFQTRNAIGRFLGSGRESRLNARIDFHVPGSVPFYVYQQIVEQIHYAQYSAATITYYRNNADPDQPRILQQQERFEGFELMREFTLRLREIISITPPTPRSEAAH